MAKILIISPISIAGELILKGFKRGFEGFAHDSEMIDVRDLKEAFGFDYVLCYDFGYMIKTEARLCVENLIKENKNIKIIHYFADNPSLNYAHSGDIELKEHFFEFCNKYKDNIRLAFWDKKYLNDFSPLKSFYFPICVDCSVYQDYKMPKKYDISFLGRPLGERRQRILSKIIKKFPSKLKIFSYPEHFKRSIYEMRKYLNKDELEAYKESFCGFIIEQEEISKIYNSSKINLNINLQGEDSLNFRTFEVLASNSFLLCDKRRDIENLGLCDVLVQYENEYDLIEKISHYLSYEDERNKICANARKLVCKHYDISARASEILNLAE